MKYKSEPSAIKNLKKIFKNTPESDSILLDQIYPTYGRDLTKEKSNKNWITNVMSHLRYHNLIVSTYTYNTGKRVLSGLQLTMKGKKALGRIETAEQSNNSHEISRIITLPFEEIKIEKEMNASEVMKAIAKLRETHPDFEITFDMKLKGI